ncbi:MAG: hypothetical protein DI585_00860 [Pseudomonas fluorescens]|nr:MAG: hypothetical protein DI585_00860 [Pseudomonas fluorescens]
MTLLAGMAAGVVLSAPAGPMGALGALQAAKGNLRGAQMLALGVCSADGFLALLATLGMGLPLPPWLLAGGSAALLLVMAWYLWRNAHKPMVVVSTTAGFGIGVSATLLHPGNVLAFAVAFNWLHAHGWVARTLVGHIALIVGVVLGALCLWMLLLHYAARLRNTRELERLIPRLQTLLAAVCACAALAAAFEFYSGLTQLHQ